MTLKKIKSSIIFFLFLCVCLTTQAQENSWNLRVYLNPVLANLPVQNQIFEDGKITSNEMSRKLGLFVGAGFDLLKRVGNDFFIGTNLSFVTKGYLATNTKIFLNGGLTGTGYSRDDLTFLETKINLEKRFSVFESNRKLLVAAGFFYGGRPRLDSDLEFYGKDYGPNISVGILMNRFYSQLEFEKGLVDIENDRHAKFKTSFIGIHVGYYIF